MKKELISISMAALLVTMALAGCSNSGSSSVADAASDESEVSGDSDSGASVDFPTQDLNGIVQWGEGGGTDSLMRPLATLAQQQLGVSVVVQNMTGGTGSIATQYVYDQDADGYYLLMGAENPALYDTLGILDITYDNFEPVILIGDETVCVAVDKDSPYNSLTEICEAALGGESITLATTGTGGMPWEVVSIVSSITGAKFTQVQYDSDASAKIAVLGGECDFTFCKIQSCLEEYKSGDLKILSVLSTDTVEQMPDVPLVTEEYPDFADYLPWGPFYGIFVKEGTDQGIIDVLSEAFAAAYEDSTYQEVLSNYNINPMGYTGDEAKEYITNWRTNTVSALESSGVTG